MRVFWGRETFLGLGAEVEEFGAPFGVKQVQTRHGRGEGETAGTGASGVEIEDSVSPVGRWLVRVAEHDDLDAIGFGVAVELVDVMQKAK